MPASDVYSPVIPLDPSLPFFDIFNKTTIAVADEIIKATKINVLIIIFKNIFIYY